MQIDHTKHKVTDEQLFMLTQSQFVAERLNGMNSAFGIESYWFESLGDDDFAVVAIMKDKEQFTAEPLLFPLYYNKSLKLSEPATTTRIY